MPGSQELHTGPLGTLDSARSVEDVGRVVRTAARKLARSEGATFVLREGDCCFYEDEDSIAPLWKGQRFPIHQCISGWAMLNNEPAVVPDIRQDSRIPLDAYLPTFVRSVLMTPVGTPPVAAIGVYWARPHRASEDLVVQMRFLAQQTAEAIARVGLESAPWAPNFAANA